MTNDKRIQVIAEAIRVIPDFPKPGIQFQVGGLCMGGLCFWVLPPAQQQQCPVRLSRERGGGAAGGAPAACCCDVSRLSGREREGRSQGGGSHLLHWGEPAHGASSASKGASFLPLQDVTTILLNPDAFRHTIDIFVERYQALNIDVVAGAR